MHKNRRAGMAAVLALSLAALPADAADAWRHWEALLYRACPGRHVDSICDGCGLDLIGGFEDTLGASDRRRISRVRDFRPCKGELFGFSCEMAVSLQAYERTRLLRRFVAYGCRAVKCEELGSCSRFPHSAP